MPKDIPSYLKTAFRPREEQERTQAPEVPERIKRHAQAPHLRPGGGWKARAEEVERQVREKHEAEKAKKEWAARRAAQQGQRLGSNFKRSAR